METIDLHTHTRWSDGTSTVENSLRCAEALGLSCFSVTDHNTVDAYAEVLQKRTLYSGRILPGVELSTVFEREVIEILGYGIRIPVMQELIRANYPTFYDKQVREAALDTRTVLEKGAVLDADFVEKMLRHPESVFDPHRDTERPYLLAELRRHPENARFFGSAEALEAIDEQQFTRNYLFNVESPLFCDQSSLSPTLSCVIEMIHQSGGLAFLAHPFAYSKHLTDHLEALAETGLDGVECHYGTFTAEQKIFLCSFCRERGLYCSGGSDFHGLDMRPKNRMGFSSGERIPLDLIREWLPLVEKQMI